jgi:signal transduction histidine kinase
MSSVGVSPVTSSFSGIYDLNTFVDVDCQREKLLIVNHLPLVRRSMINELSRDYVCVEASSVLEAINLLKQEKFAVVVAEKMLPGLSGIELLRSVVANYPDTDVVIISEVDRPQRALDAVRLGAFDCLIRPYEPIVLQMTVERAIERQRLRVEAKRYKRDLEKRNIELERGKRELQRLQAQIVHSEKMASLGQLAAGVAHELNNPVGFVFGNLDILKDRIEAMTRLLRYYDYTPIDGTAAVEVDNIKRETNYDSSHTEIKEILDDCIHGAVRIRDIVNNLRTFSRLDEAEFKKTDINEGLNSTVRLLSKYFSAENITLVRDFGELPEVEVYAGQLNQVWMNLLANAAQAVSKTGGEVTIATRFANNKLSVSVRDTGPGISPQVIEKIFDPFFTTKPVGEGSGLGLSIAFGIVERHKGTISVESEPGNGTTFTVEIPVER